MKNKLLLYTFLTILSVFGYSTMHAQYFLSMGLAPGNPGGINKDSDAYFAGTPGPPSGSTVLYNYPVAKTYSLQYMPTQTIPFTFNFNGGPVTQYKISTSGYITFSKTSTTPTGPANTALPAATLPDSSICVWGMAGAGEGGQIYTKVYGTSPNQQLWIVWWFGGNPSDTNSQNIWAVVLEQTTNNIYLVDEWGDITIAASGVYKAPKLTLGVQVNSTTAYQVPASPSVVSHTWFNGNSDNIYYEFSPTASTAYTPAAKTPMFEEFNQASCDPCAQATPNLDSVLYNNRNAVSAVRYHVNWPGQDFMNQVTETPFIGARVTYYSVGAVPDAKLDGSMDIYPGGIRSIELQDEAFIGSPFTISISSATYDITSGLYSASAVITAQHVMPSGLVAQAVLTVDTLTYTKNQSTETIPQTVFPQVSEDMMPTSSGTSLGAFSSVGATQTVNVTWTKNHAWGNSSKTWPYDSNKDAAHITFFIQNNSTKYIYQSANMLVSNFVGIQELNDVNYFNLYPNPAHNDINVEFVLAKDASVNVEMYNMLGEKVYANAQGTLGAGSHMITINSQSFSSGVYFVRFITENGAIVRKVVVQ